MAVLGLLLVMACGGDPGVDVLGGGKHKLDRVNLRYVEGIPGPTDLAFHPDLPDEIWSVGTSENALYRVQEAHGDANIAVDDGMGASHFLARPAALAFADEDWFATIHFIDEPTQATTPANFMGPTLWTTDPDEFEGGHASHYDMLHNTPNGAGIAWEHENVFWVFDGYHGSLTRYDFGHDHGPGGEDHSDGDIRRYLDGQLAALDEVGAHVVFDHTSQMVYAADTGNRRIVRVNPWGAEKGSRISPNYDGGDQFHYDGAELETIAVAVLGDLALEAPSGLEIHDGLLWVSDFETGVIAALTLEGERVDYLTLDAAPSGMAFDADGDLWVADRENDRLIEISPKE